MRLSQIPRFLVALREALQAHPALQEVVIATGPLGDGLAGAQAAIEFGTAAQTQEWAALGKLARRETFTVTGWVFVVQYGADEAVITATRERAYALLDAVAETLWHDPTVGHTVRQAGITRHELQQVITGETGNARGCGILFEITAEATQRRAD